MRLIALILLAAFSWLISACTITPAVSGDGLAITGVTIIAAPTEPPIPDGTLLVRDGLIIAAGPADGIAVPAGYERLDATGLFAVAGYWNSHAHLVSADLADPLGADDSGLSAYFTSAYLQFGFTTILDLASETTLAVAVANRITISQIAAPRLLTAGSPFYPPEGTPIYARPIYEAYGLPSAEITDIGAAVARLDAQADVGVRAVKLFTGAIVGEPIGVMPMAGPDVRALTAAAHQRGLPVFAHPTDSAGLTAAVENGAGILAHPAPLSGTWDADLAEGLARQGLGMTPTLRLFELFPHPATPVDLAVQQAAALHAAGGDILFGTDAGFSPEYDPQGEWALMSRFMTAPEILASLTTLPAKRLGEAGQRGELRAGQAADIVLLGSNPLENYRHLGSVEAVLKAGRVVFVSE